MRRARPSHSGQDEVRGSIPLIGSRGFGSETGWNMKSARFEIRVSDYSSSVEDWRRAQQAAHSELPELTAEQKDMAKKFKISEEEYARGVLAGNYGRERNVARARRLGDMVQHILDELDGGGRVVAVGYDLDRPRWIIGIQTHEGHHNVAVPRELADDVVDWGLREKIEELRSRVAYGVGGDKAAGRPVTI